MAVGEKVYIADKATQDEINQNVDGIVSNIGTTTDSGATSTTGTLMGKANAILEKPSFPQYQNSFSGDFAGKSSTSKALTINGSGFIEVGCTVSTGGKVFFNIDGSGWDDEIIIFVSNGSVYTVHFKTSLSAYVSTSYSDIKYFAQTN